MIFETKGRFSVVSHRTAKPEMREDGGHPRVLKKHL